MSEFVPPRVELSWNPTALGGAYGGTRVLRRPSRIPVVDWTTAADFTVPDGYTSSIVEAQHIGWVDFQPGWAIPGGQWADGWDYSVQVYNKTTGMWSDIASFDARNIVTPDDDTWYTNNDTPWLNHVVFARELAGDDLDDFRVYKLAQRDLAVTRTSPQIPARQYRLSWQPLPTLGEDVARYGRVAARRNRGGALMLPTGDRVLGSIGGFKLTQSASSLIAAQATFVETTRGAQPSDHNLPACVVLNGSSQYISVPDTPALDPGTNPFTVVLASTFADTASTALSKGNLGTTDGYGFRRSAAGTMQFLVDGASASGGPTDASPVWFDGALHVAVGVHGFGQILYRDGIQVGSPTAIAPGSITNALALVVGANNAGASGFMASRPQSFAVYDRSLTPDEVKVASYHLLGYPGYRMPAGAVLFVDLRDQRTWRGFGTALNDLSPSGLTASLVGTPPTRGIPWPLEELEAA